MTVDHCRGRLNYNVMLGRILQDEFRCGESRCIGVRSELAHKELWCRVCVAIVQCGSKTIVSVSVDHRSIKGLECSVPDFSILLSTTFSF